MMYHGYNHTIPEDWEPLLIKDLIKFSGGSQPPLSSFAYEETEGYIRLIQTRDYRSNKHKTYIKRKDAKKICNADDIMIGRYGPPLFQIFKGIEGAYNVALVKAVPNEKKVIRDYCFYFLSRPELRSYLESLSQRSGGQTGIEMDRLLKYPFPLPPYPEQQKIAEILKTWDEALKKCGKALRKLKSRNKGLAQQLLTGKKRLKGYDGEWKNLRIVDIASQQTIYNKSNLELEVLSCTKYDGLVRSLDYFGRQVFGEDLSKYKIVPKGSFAYATNHIEEGSIGYQDILDQGLISPMYTVFKTKNNVNDQFLYKLLKTEKMIYAYQSNMIGSINRRGGLRWKDFSTIQISIPDKKEQSAINNVLTDANQELKLYEQKLANLQEQKKGLMQKLLTGEIRVNVK